TYPPSRSVQSNSFTLPIISERAFLLWSSFVKEFRVKSLELRCGAAAPHFKNKRDFPSDFLSRRRRRSTISELETLNSSLYDQSFFCKTLRTSSRSFGVS